MRHWLEVKLPEREMHKPIEKDDLPILMPYWPDEQIKRAFFKEFTSPMNFERLGRAESPGASPSHHAARAYVAMIEAQRAKAGCAAG
jgi:hypothetical protein